MSEQCPTCGAPVGSGGGSGSDALIQHVTDYNDPHRTLSHVPRTYYGNSAPVVTDGYKSGDWYVDVANRVIYSCASVTGEHGLELSWVPASTATAVTAAMLATALAPYATSASVQAILSSYVTTSVAASFVTADQLAARNYATQSFVTSALNGYATQAYVTGLGYTTLSAVQAYLSANYVSNTVLALALTPYYTKTEADARFVTPSALSGFVSSSDVATTLSHGFVYRQPTEPGVWPTLDLDAILGPYLTSSAASATYLTKTAAANTYSTPASVQAALAGYVTALGLSSTLASYYTAAQCDARYVTPAYLSAQGYLRSSSSDFFANFVTRSATGSRDIDTILASWAVNELNASSTLPPQSRAVKAAIDAEAGLRTALEDRVAQLESDATTYGRSMPIVRFSAATTLGGNKYFLCTNYAVNVIAGSQITSLLDGSELRIILPTNVSNDCVAADVVFTVIFPQNGGTGQVPFTMAPPVLRYSVNGSYVAVSPRYWSRHPDPFSLDGVVFGSVVSWCFTSILPFDSDLNPPADIAVTRKVMYPVEVS